MQANEGRRWRIGELAQATGVSPRALRHYCGARVAIAYASRRFNCGAPGYGGSGV